MAINEPAKNLGEPSSFLLPVRFTAVGSSILVHLVRAETLEFGAGFFRDVLRTRENAALPDVLVGLEEWLEGCDGQRWTPARLSVTARCEVGKIFHVSRCGSTLLATNLHSTASFLVLGEPEFCHDLYGQNSTLVGERLSMVARMCILQWQCYAASLGRRLVIKYSSQLARRLPEIRRDFPAAPFVHLCREPVAVLESLVRKFPRHLLARIENSTGSDVSKASSSESERAEAAAHSYLSIIGKLAPRSDELNFLLDYEELPTRFGEVVAFLAGGADARPGLASRESTWSSTWDAKQGLEATRVYVPVPRQSLESFAYRHSAQLRECLAHYQRRKIVAAGASVGTRSSRTPDVMGAG